MGHKLEILLTYRCSRLNYKGFQEKNISGEIFNVGSGKTVSVNRIIDILGGKKYLFPKDQVNLIKLLQI